MMSDYYVIHDFLNGRNFDKIDILLQTPGGSGETVEEIVRVLRKKTNHVSFVIAGEAKSAGTILALSGNEILMTETGSLGPIDAQVRIGRSPISAFDYIEWVKDKQKEAQEKGTLNPFDSTVIAQITPGEINGVFHSLTFAEDLVVEWLPKYKFADWNQTEGTKKTVTPDMKIERAKEIAKALTDHGRWRSHGRSIKIEDLETLLQIQKIDSDPELADIVYRIHVVLRLLCDSTSTFKIFMTSDDKIFRQATQAPVMPFQHQPTIPGDIGVIHIDQQCPGCGIIHKLYAKTKQDPKIDESLKAKGFKPFPKDGKIMCTCKKEIDMIGIKNQIEMSSGLKLII